MGNALSSRGLPSFLLGGVSLSLVLSISPPEALQADTSKAVLQLGERVYVESCVACHGEKGDGKGPQAYRLKTKPRDFTKGIYKFRSTPSGSLPLDEDLVRVLTNGVRGTSMLRQLHLSKKEEMWAVAQYLKSFSPRFGVEKPKKPIAIPPGPKQDKALVAFGRSLYDAAGCAQCHGSEGKGDGPSAKDLRDAWAEPIAPADLTRRPFKSGPKPEDLYRTLSTGLDGTPMPSYADALSVKEIWALAYYIQSSAKESPRERGMMGMMNLVGEENLGMMIDMRAAMAGMMGREGMMRDMMR